MSNLFKYENIQKVILFFKEVGSKFLDANFIALLSILITLLLFFCEQKSLNDSKENAFRKKIIVNNYEIYSNSSSLYCNQLSLASALKDNKVIQKKDSIKLRENLIHSQELLMGLKESITSEIYIELVSENHLSDISYLFNKLTKTHVELKSLNNKPLDSLQVKLIDEIVSKQVFLAAGLNKIFKFNMNKELVKSFDCFSEVMENIYNQDYKEIKFNVNLKDENIVLFQ